MGKDSIEWNLINENINSEIKEGKIKYFSNKKILFPFIFSLLATIIQFLFFQMYSWLSQNHVTNGKHAYVISSKKLSKGEILDENNTKLSYFDLGSSKDKFILNSEFKNFSGRKLKFSVEEKTPLLKSSVLDDSENSSHAEKIPPGKRFYTLELDVGPVSSLLHIGDRVDLIAHMNIEGYGKAIETILSKIKIVGIGNNLDDNLPGSEVNALSFYLTPEEVKIISFMKPYSHFTIALRNPNDYSVDEDDPITFNKFIQNDKIQKIFTNDSFKIVEGKKLEKIK